MVMLGKSRCSWEKDEVGNKIGLMSTGPIRGEAERQAGVGTKLWRRGRSPQRSFP